MLSTLDWGSFRFGVLLIEINCWNYNGYTPYNGKIVPAPSDHNRTRALLREHGYSYITRHSMDEIWGDLRLPWVRHGARRLLNQGIYRATVCLPHPEAVSILAKLAMGGESDAVLADTPEVGLGAE